MNKERFIMVTKKVGWVVPLLAGLFTSGKASACAGLVAQAMVFGLMTYQQALVGIPDCAGPIGGQASTAAPMLVATQGQHIDTIMGTLGARRQNASVPQSLAANQLDVSGMAAGGEAPSWNAWASADYNSYRYTQGNFDPAVTNIDVSFKGRTNSFVLGVDKQLSSTSTLGVSVAFDDSNTKYYGLQWVAPAEIPTSLRGYTISPYYSMQLSNSLALDVTLGFGKGDLKSSDGLGGTSASRSTRQFAALNLSHIQWIDKIQLTTSGKIVHSSERYNDAVLSDLSPGGAGTVVAAGSANRQTLDQLSGHFKAGYWVGSGIMPYVDLGLSYDANSSTASGVTAINKTTFPINFGIDLISTKSNLTGGLFFRHEFGRSQTRSDSLTANINYRF